MKTLALALALLVTTACSGVEQTPTVAPSAGPTTAQTPTSPATSWLATTPTAPTAAPTASGSLRPTTAPQAEACTGKDVDWSSLPPVAQAYGKAWNERGAKKRLALVQDALADEGSYRDPAVDAPVVGQEALADHIGAFQGGSEDYFEPLPWTPADVHHDRMRMPWRLCDTQGDVLLIGIDVGTLASDGRFSEIAGFFEEPSTVPTEDEACAGPASLDWSGFPEIVRRYGDAWMAMGSLDAFVMLKMIWAENGVYVDPFVQTPVVGRLVLSNHMANTMGVGQYMMEVSEWSGNDLHHERLRIRWRHCCPSGAILLEGEDMGEIDRDGRLSRVTSFWTSGGSSTSWFMACD